jgi:hypothetical protein
VLVFSPGRSLALSILCSTTWGSKLWVCTASLQVWPGVIQIIFPLGP